MKLYDSSDQVTMQRSYLGTKVYMASHPSIRKLFRSGGRPTDFGDKVWDSTLGLMTHLHSERYATIMDIGCGWGILGIHLARMWGADVTCIDADPKLQPVVNLHAQLNNIQASFVAAKFSEISSSMLNCELIVGSEICYDESVCEDLCKLVDLASTTRVKKIVIADPGRPDFDDLYIYCKKKYETFMAPLKLKGWDKDRHVMTVVFS